MADNVTLQNKRLATPLAGEVIAAQDVDGVKYQEVIVMGATGDGTWKALRMDTTTHSGLMMGYEHHEIHSGSHYFVSGVQDLAQLQVLDFTWQMPNTEKWIHWTWRIATEAETLWQVYEDVVETNELANAVTPLNSNRNSDNTSGTIMFFEIQANLVAANVDTDVSGGTLIESGISGDGKTAGNSVRQNELILKQAKLYCLRATATKAGFISFDMQWYEHTSRSA